MKQKVHWEGNKRFSSLKRMSRCSSVPYWKQHWTTRAESCLKTTCNQNNMREGLESTEQKLTSWTLPVTAAIISLMRGIRFTFSKDLTLAFSQVALRPVTSSKVGLPPFLFVRRAFCSWWSCAIVGLLCSHFFLLSGRLLKVPDLLSGLLVNVLDLPSRGTAEPSAVFRTGSSMRKTNANQDNYLTFLPGGSCLCFSLPFVHVSIKKVIINWIERQSDEHEDVTRYKSS